ncbi:MAG: hypothetical protein M1120_03020 [Patescibacteria group bacterium]|nr:hypothetical protein [Patescibacteria group bacterium]
MTPIGIEHDGMEICDVPTGKVHTIMTNRETIVGVQGDSNGGILHLATGERHTALNIEGVTTRLPSGLEIDLTVLPAKRLTLTI